MILTKISYLNLSDTSLSQPHISSSYFCILSYSPKYNLLKTFFIKKHGAIIFPNCVTKTQECQENVIDNSVPSAVKLTEDHYAESIIETETYKQKGIKQVIYLRCKQYFCSCNAQAILNFFYNNCQARRQILR